MRRLIIINIAILTLVSCSNQDDKIISTQNFDSQKVAKYFSSRVGISPPKQLLEYWDKTWENRGQIELFEYGTFNILYPDQIISQTLGAPPNYAKVNLSNAYYAEYKDEKISRQEYDSLVRLMENDPLLHSQTIRKSYITDDGRHLKISYGIAFARMSNRTGRLFMGFDSSGKLLGIYYYPNEQIVWPILIAKDLNDLIENCQGRLTDVSQYIESNSHYFVHLGSNKNEIADFYTTSYKKVFGDSLMVSINDKEWDFTIIKYKKNFINFRVDANLGNVQRMNFIHNALNLQAHYYRTPEFYSYYEVRNGYVCVLSNSQAVDFAKKGLIELDYFNQPIELFVPKEMTKRKQMLLKEFQELDDKSKEQFMKDFFE
jgi:hypothetical protein